MLRRTHATRASVLLMLCASGAAISSSQTLTTLVSFNGTNGGTPAGALVQAFNGNLYGATTSGGTYNRGTIFEITPGGVLTSLHSFSQNDGAHPFAGLVQATNGFLYGTSARLGTSTVCNFGCGTIFKITPAGALTAHSFDYTHGDRPEAALIQAANGYLYGTTYLGGPGGQGGPSGYGMVFSMSLAGALTTLHRFDSTDGAFPAAGLVQATNGYLYGTTVEGGTNNAGTIFRITPGGVFTSLHSFVSTDGANPSAGLVQATNGYLYGTTGYGGANNTCLPTCGTIFRITPAGALTTLHSFDGTDGYEPFAGLMQATDGNLYGTTAYGGANNYGTIFKITPAGALTTLYSFSKSDGAQPFGNLLQATDGNLYGETKLGETNNQGTIFSLSVGLGPFVKTLPASGDVGTAVTILGTNLFGATGVTFNGVSAGFTIVQPSEITTSVPAGATTGEVQVFTPGGTLVSNVAFRVP